MHEASAAAPAAQARGFLAIWSTVSAADETDYLHWLTREHIAERLGVAGFMGCAVYRAIATERRYFIRYTLADPAVVGSAAYLARLNAPTPWSQRIMPKLGDFVRGGGRILMQAGEGRGAWCAAIAIDPGMVPDAEGLVARVGQADRITSASLLATDRGSTSIPTNEKGIRSGDGSFDGLLLVEGLDEQAVREAIAAAGLAAEAAMHQLVFAR